MNSLCQVIPSLDEEFGPSAYDVQIKRVRYGVSRELFSGELSFDAKRRLFKRFVTRVLLEISSYCNRKCTFCPNNSGVRLSKSEKRNRLDSRVFHEIVEALESIDYREGIILHLYNEPMADPALSEKVAAITSRLPHANVCFNTNGDYLSVEALKDLANARLTRLSISLYGPNHGQFDQAYLRESFERVFEIIGVRPEIISRPPHKLRAHVAFNHDGWTIPISVFASDYNAIGYDRARSVRTDAIVSRTTPCPAPFSELNVAWDGTVVPCCNIHPQLPAHAKYLVGKVVQGSDIFDVYHGASLRAWRRSLAKFGEFDPPCDTCSRLNFKGLQKTDSATLFNEKMEQLLVAAGS